MTDEGQASSEKSSYDDVAEEMHTEQDAGNRNAESAEEKGGEERGVEFRESNGNGKGSDGMAGRERETIGRQQSSPAMRFNLTGAAAAGEMLQSLEGRDSRQRGRSGCGNGG